jgi:murein DD-endopeptidase MepM/ murein hydrolase activator NlpD
MKIDDVIALGQRATALNKNLRTLDMDSSNSTWASGNPGVGIGGAPIGVSGQPFLRTAADVQAIVPGTRLGSRYGPRRAFEGETFHHGVDIPAAEGTPIYSSSSGTVVYSGITIERGTGYRNYGNALGVNIGNSTIVVYGHMRDLPLIVVGGSVSAGQLIGYIGHTGLVVPGPGRKGDHLHYEIRVSGKSANPVVGNIP